VQVLESPYISSISHAVGNTIDSMDIYGVNFGVTVSFKYGSTEYEATIIEGSTTHFKVDVPGGLDGSTLPWSVIVYNQGLSSEDSQVADHNSTMTLYIYDGDTGGAMMEDIGDQLALLALDSDTLGLGHTGTGRGMFSLEADAGMALEVRVQLLDYYGDTVSGTPSLGLIAPDGTELSPSSESYGSGLLISAFDGDTSLPATGAYTLVASATPESYFSISVFDHTDLMGGDGLSVVSGNNQVIDPRTQSETDPMVVQVMAGATAVEEAGIPVVFESDETVLLTDANGQASLTVPVAEPGEYVTHLAHLAGVGAGYVQFSAYSEDVQEVEGDSIQGIFHLDFGANPVDGVAGGTISIPLKARNNIYGLAPDGSTVMVTIAEDNPGYFDGGLKYKLFTLNASGSTVVTINVGDSIDCDGCRAEAVQRKTEDPFKSMANIYELRAVAYTPDGDTVSDIFEKARAFAGEPAALSIINKEALVECYYGYAFIGLPAGNWLCWTPQPDSIVVVEDVYGNPVANQKVNISSNYSTLNDLNIIYSSGIIHPTIYDDSLNWQSDISLSTDTSGFVFFIWVMYDIPEEINTLDVVADGYPSLEDSCTLTGMDFTGWWSTGSVTILRGVFNESNPWRMSDTTQGQEVWRVIPYPYPVRLFKMVSVSEGNSIWLKAEPFSDEHYSLKLKNYYGTGRVAADPWDIGLPETGSSVTVAFSSTTDQAMAYWAPGYSGNYSRLYYQLFKDAQMIINTYYSFNKNGDTLISAQVISKDGSSRSLEDGGIALTSEQEIKVSLHNTLDLDWWLKVESEPFGNGADAFDWTQIQDYETSGSYKYFLVPAQTDRIVDLIFREDASGADVKLSAVYSRTLWTERNEPYGPPDEDNEDIPFEELEFRVGSVKIKQIDVMRDVWASGVREIDLYNGLGAKDVPDPEWIRHAREIMPTHEHYGDSITAPTAVLKGEKLSFKVEYECSGLDSFDLGAVCDGTTSSNSCPYGDVASQSINCGILSQLYPYEVLYSDTSVSTVMASMNHYKWQVSDIDYGNTSLTGNTIEIEETYHRIYSLHEHPLDYSLDTFIDWLVPLELSFSLLDACDSDYSTPDGIRACITKGAFNSWWMVSDSLYFSKSPRQLDYGATKLPTDTVKYSDFTRAPYLFSYFRFDLTNFIVDLTYPSQSAIGADCKEYNSITNFMLKSIGVDMNSRHFDTYHSDDFVFSGVISPDSIVDTSFVEHYVNEYPAGSYDTRYVYDAMLKYKDGEDYYYFIGNFSERQYADIMGVNVESIWQNLPVIYGRVY